MEARIRNGVVVLVILSCATEASPADPTYWQDVRPLLRKQCLACHSKRSQAEIEVSGGLALDSYEAALRGSKHPVIVPGKAHDSLVLRRVLAEDEEQRMPPRGKRMPAEAVAILRQWIEAGAPEGERPRTAAEPRRARPTRIGVAITTPVVPPPEVFAGKPHAPLTLSLRMGPLNPATAVAFSPDGQLLACGSHSLVTLWDLRLGQCVRSLPAFQGAVHAVRFSPDGRLVAVAGGRPAVSGEVRLFQVADGKPVGTLTGHEDVVTAIDFNGTGKRLLSGSFDRTVRIWDLETRKSLQVLTGHADEVRGVAFAPDGTWVASVGKDRMVRVVEADSGKLRLSLTAVDELNGMAISPDGQWIVAGGEAMTLYWWSSRSGERSRTVGGHHAAVADIVFCRDGRLLASVGADRTVRLWDGATGVEKHAEKLPESPYAVALSGDGRRVAVACFDGRVRLYEAASGKLLLSMLALTAESGEAQWLAQTPAGHLIGSPKLLINGRWKMGEVEIAKDTVWKAVFDPEAVARSARGEPLSPPQFR
jgi:WD40 repeat protein